MPDLDPFEFPFQVPGGPAGGRPSEGPVNWQVAEQVAAWSAQEASRSGEREAEGGPTPEYSELFRLAELRLEGLAPPAPPLSSAMTTPELASPPEWARASVGEFRFVLELLGRQLNSISGLEPEEAPLPPPVQAIMAPMLPVLLGGQFGLLLGKTASWIYSGFDVLLPRTAAPRPKVVPAAVTAAARDYELDANDAGLWVALHESVHLRQFHVPWVRKFLAQEVEKAIERIEFRPEAVAEKLSELDPSDPASLEAFTENPTGLLDALLAPAPRQQTEVLRAAVAVLEASAEHIAAVAAVEISADPQKAREMLRRHHLEAGATETFLLRLSGVRPDGKDYQAALAFCQFVTSDAGFEALSALWKGPESLPSFEELSDPQSWLRRIAPST